MLIIESTGRELFNPSREALIASLDNLTDFCGVKNYAMIYSHDAAAHVMRWVDENDRYWLSYTKEYVEGLGWVFTREFPEIIVDAEHRDLLLNMFIGIIVYKCSKNPKALELITDMIVELQDGGLDLWPTLYPDEAKARAEKVSAIQDEIAHLFPQSPTLEFPEEDKLTETDPSDKTSKSESSPNETDTPWFLRQSIPASAEQSDSKIEEDCQPRLNFSPTPPETPSESVPFWLRMRDDSPAT